MASEIELVAGITYVFELPFHLGVPDGAIIVGFGSSTPAGWDGWQTNDFEELLGTDQLPTPMMTPRLRLEFRTLERVAPTAVAHAKIWFPWLDDPDEPRSDCVHKHSQQPTHDRTPQETVSIVACTRFIGPDTVGEHDPSDAAAMDDMIDNARDELLACLSDYCVSFAAITDDVRVRAIELADLPPAVPVYSQLFKPGVIKSDRALIEIHKRWAGIGRPIVDERAAEQIDLLFRSRTAAGGPNILFDAYELFVQGRQDLAVGRFSSAVRQVATAVETLVMTTFREIAGRHASESRVEGWLRSGYKNVLTDHLPRELGIHIDITTGSTDPVGAWVHGGYKARNDAVHAGRRPTRDQASDAVEQALALRDWLRDSVAGRADLCDLATWFLYREADRPHR